MSQPPSGIGFERYIARRYLRGARGRGLVSFVTTIAVGGVAVGVMALIVVIGVLTGLQDQLRERILGGGPHAVTLELNNGFRMDAWPMVLERIRADESVAAAAPFAYSEVLLNAGDSYNQGIVLRGMAPGEEADRVTSLVDHLVLGQTPFEPTESGLPGMVVGRGLAERLGRYLSKKVTVASLQNAELTSLGFSPQMARFEVVGFFQTGLYQYDDELAIPFAVKFPGVRVREPRVECSVELIDILPTLCSYLGIEAPEHTFGRDFFGRSGPRFGIGEGVMFKGRNRAIRNRTYKLLWEPDGPAVRGDAELQLFNVAEDPAETRDLLSPDYRTEQTQQIADRLAARIEDAVPPFDAPAAEFAPLDPVIEERLRSLGYLE